MKYLIMLISFLISNHLFAVNDTIQVSSKISDATVFFSGAQLSRKGNVSLKKGKQLLVFESLPVGLDPLSVQVDHIPSAQILFVKHELYKDKGTAALYDEKESLIEAIQLEISYIKNEIEVLQIEEKVLMDNSVIQRGEEGVAINDLREAATFYRTRLTDIRKRILDAKVKLKKKDKTLQAAFVALNKYKSETEKEYSRVFVSLESATAQQKSVELRYYIDNAGWSPQYDFRVEELNEPLKVVYQANLYQTSGEDWENVHLKLSTGEPSLSNQKPEFEEWIVYENNPYKDINRKRKKVKSSKNTLQGLVVDLNNEPLPFANVVIKGTASGVVTDFDGKFIFRPIADGWYDLEISFIGFETLNRRVQVIHGMSNIETYVLHESTYELNEVFLVDSYEEAAEPMSYSIRSNVSKKGVSSLVPHNLKEKLTHLEYDIDLPYTILSDSEDQQIKIKEVSVEAMYAYHAVPRLDRDVFLVAEIPQWNQLQLLSAPMNIYNQGTFSGSSYIDANFSGDTLSVSLGRDQNIVVEQNLLREKNDKRIFGSNVKETIAWNISVKNNKNLPIRIIVEDQHPISEHKSVAMEFEIPETAKHNAKRGTVRWEVSMNPGEKQDFNYQYSIKYDKSLSLDLK